MALCLRSSKDQRNRRPVRRCTSAYLRKEVWTWLISSFPGRWIEKRRPISWPRSSPDLTLCDFPLRGHLKQPFFKSELTLEGHWSSLRFPNSRFFSKEDAFVLMKTCTYFPFWNIPEVPSEGSCSTWICFSVWNNPWLAFPQSWKCIGIQQ